MTIDSNVPFYLMRNNEKPDLPRYPDNPDDQIAGLEEAIKNTEKSIAEGKYSKEELNTHLERLKKGLENAKKRK